MNSKKKRNLLIGAGTAFIIAILLLIMKIAFGLLDSRTKHIENDYSSIYNNEKYASPMFVDNIDVIKQEVSCGYAVIEMFSAWNGNDITEGKLYSEYGKVVTSTGKTFCNEMNKQFPTYNTTMYKYLTNTELIEKVYNSLSNGYPVPFEWAAKYEDKWTLHYSLITGLDINNDKVTVANPYGYYEIISIRELLERTSFEAYSDMPIFLKLGFVFGIFEKNTIFIVE